MSSYYLKPSKKLYDNSQEKMICTLKFIHRDYEPSGPLLPELIPVSIA